MLVEVVVIVLVVPVVPLPAASFRRGGEGAVCAGFGRFLVYPVDFQCCVCAYRHGTDLLPKLRSRRGFGLGLVACSLF